MMTLLLFVSTWLATQDLPKVIQNRLEVTARELVSNFTAGRFDETTKDFNEALRVEVTPEVLANLKRDTDHEYGDFQSITAIGRRVEDGVPIVDLVCKFTRSPVVFSASFDADYRIAAVSINPMRVESVDPALEATARELLRNFVGREFEAMTKHFDENLRKQMPASQLAVQRAKVALSYGAFISVTDVHAYKDETYRTIELITKWERSLVSLKIAFDKDGQVTGMKLVPADQ